MLENKSMKMSILLRVASLPPALHTPPRLVATWHGLWPTELNVYDKTDQIYPSILDRSITHWNDELAGHVAVVFVDCAELLEANATRTPRAPSTAVIFEGITEIRECRKCTLPLGNAQLKRAASSDVNIVFVNCLYLEAHACDVIPMASITNFSSRGLVVMLFLSVLIISALLPYGNQPKHRHMIWQTPPNLLQLAPGCFRQD